MTTLTHPTCEYRANPLGIDVRQPRLGWQMESPRRGARQTAYQLLAAASETDLAGDQNLLWDSGKIDSDQSAHLPYGGPALGSGQRVYWMARAWDENGTAAETQPAWWEMGLLEADDWQAQWIGSPLVGGPHTTSPAPYLRCEFTPAKAVASARLYATAVGLYECHLNGSRVGEDLLTPGWTDYTKHIQYQVYDVTSLLKPGANALGTVLGDGWGVGHVAWVGRQRYAERPQFLAQLLLN